MVTAPHPQSLAIIGLGGSVPTPPEGIEAPAVIFPTYADLLAAAPGSLTGKIAVVTQPMARTQDASGYGADNPPRRSGPSEAAKRGAVAYLVRSLATGESREPHTGALNYAADAPKIPAAALSVIDAELLDQMAARGPGTGYTVVGDIPGAVHPDQMIVVGGHLDSWDPGTGSIDDGAGMAITVAAAHLAGSVHPPARTLRVALFGAEEMDFSNGAFTAAHQAEAAHIVVIGEADIGADNAWSLQLPAGGADLPEMKTLAASLAPLKIYVSPEPALHGGSDIVGLIKAGVPVVEFRQDASRYFDWHHSSEDTMDKIDPAQLNQNVAAWAAFLYIVANTDVDFRAAAPPAPVATPPKP